jgi:5'/3'-nucleotidase SurE
VTFRATRTDFTCGSTTSSTWAVGGWPSDAVLFGLSMMADARPDLVISGMNFGQTLVVDQQLRPWLRALLQARLR